MEKTGLIIKLNSDLNQSWNAQLLVNESQEIKKRNTALGETLATLKAIKLSKNLTLALGAEEMMLRQELASYANSSEQHNSISGAINQLQEARKSLKIVQDHDAYKSATDTYSGKNKEAGLPLDSFRQFLKSHSTRFTNSMKSTLSVPEKNILRQRKENLGMVKEVYMDLQRQALGLPVPKKEFFPVALQTESMLKKASAEKT